MHFYNRCLPFHYGTPEIQGTGTCEACNCNGNSDQCNTRTGDCIFCENNTTGRNCERCKDGFYGNATLKTCTRKYSRARLVRTQNTRKLCANYPSMRIIRAYFMLRFCQWWRVVYRTERGFLGSGVYSPVSKTFNTVMFCVLLVVLFLW